MTPNQRTYFNRQLRRHALLLQLEAASPATLPAETLMQGMRLAGHAIHAEDFLKEAAYLADKGYLDNHEPDLDHGYRRYRLTAAGRDYLEAHGLA